MTDYESPAIAELGSIADFTRGDRLSFSSDGMIFHRNDGGGGSGTS